MKLYANPFNPDAPGFYFETFEEYQEKVAVLKDSFWNPVEEFEFHVIDGSRDECELVKAIGINQVNLEEVMEYIDTYDEDEWPTIFYLLDNGVCDDLDDAKRQASNYSVVQDSLLDAATELFDDCYIGLIPKESRQFIEQYIDYDRFANDCEAGGDMVEFEFGGKTYTCTNANH